MIAANGAASRTPRPCCRDASGGRLGFPSAIVHRFRNDLCERALSPPLRSTGTRRAETVPSGDLVSDDSSISGTPQEGAETSADAPGVPRVSLVIPVYNAEATIEQCLESVFAQEANFEFDVIVADSSTDRTPEIIAAKFPSVRYVRLEQRAYPGTARNAAIRHARGKIIAMTDADCIVDSHLLARMVAEHESGEYEAVGGAICNGTPTSPSGTIGYLLEFREFIPAAPRREVVTIPTANISYRREVFERLGLFDDVRASEDLLFNWRL